MDAIRNWDGLNVRSDYTIAGNYILSVEDTDPDSVVEPVTLAEAKLWLEVDYTDKDTLITRLIKVARKQIEKELNKALAPQTLKVKIQSQKGFMDLPYWTPEAEIVEVTDHEGETVLDSNYEVNNGVLVTSFDQVVYVEYETGFETCPEDYKQMILERVSFLDANRGDISKTNNNGIWLA